VRVDVAPKGKPLSGASLPLMGQVKTATLRRGQTRTGGFLEHKAGSFRSVVEYIRGSDELLFAPGPRQRGVLPADHLRAQRLPARVPRALGHV